MAPAQAHVYFPVPRVVHSVISCVSLSSISKCSTISSSSNVLVYCLILSRDSSHSTSSSLRYWVFPFHLLCVVDQTMETDRQTLQPGLVRDYEPDKYSTYVRVGLGPDELFPFPIEPHCSVGNRNFHNLYAKFSASYTTLFRSVLFSAYTYFLLIDHA